MSDPGPPITPGGLLADPLPINSFDGLPPSPATHTFADMRTPSGSTIKTKRLSLLAKRDVSPPSAYPAPSSMLTAELEAERTELSTAQKELDSIRHQLAEANDKRDASDACIKALREFIAEQSIGEAGANVAASSASIKDDVASFIGSPNMSMKGLRLPPLPTEENIEDSASSSAPQQKKSGSGWFWRNNTGTPNEAAQSAPVAAASSSQSATTSGDGSQSTSSTPLTSFVSSWTRSVSGGNVPQTQQAPATSPSAEVPPSAPAAGPLRKFNFFNKAAAAPSPAATNSATPSIAESTATPELSHSETTSPQTDARSLASGVLSEEDEGQELLLPSQPTVKENLKGDVTPTLSTGEVDPEKLEPVAL